MKFILKCMFFFVLSDMAIKKNLQPALISKGQSGNRKQRLFLGLFELLIHETFCIRETTSLLKILMNNIFSENYFPSCVLSEWKEDLFHQTAAPAWSHDRQGRLPHHWRFSWQCVCAGDIWVNIQLPLSVCLSVCCYLSSTIYPICVRCKNLKKSVLFVIHLNLVQKKEKNEPNS